MTTVTFKIKVPSFAERNKTYKSADRERIYNEFKKYIEECCKKKLMPSMEGFCTATGYPRGTLVKWDELKPLKEWIRCYWIDTLTSKAASTRDDNSTGTRFLLGSMGFRDDDGMQDYQEIKVVFGKKETDE